MVVLQQDTIRPKESTGQEKDPLRQNGTIRRPGTTGKPRGGVCLPPGQDRLKAQSKTVDTNHEHKEEIIIR